MKIYSGTLCLIVIVVIFFAGILVLFNLRYDKSDNLPSYSSLRADPLGSRIFYESLSNMNDLNVWRNFKSYYQLPTDINYTFFFLGSTVDFLKNISENDYKKLHSHIQNGNRFIFTLTPCINFHSSAKSQNDISQQGEEGEGEEKVKNEEDFVKERWGISFLETSGNSKYNREELTLRIATNSAEIPWYSNIHFETGEEWNIILKDDDRNFIVERTIGKGSLVFLSDSYLISNEAMFNDCYSWFLSWLIGNNKNIIFDETHLGIVHKTNIVELAKRYRLHGFFFGLIILVVLYVWKNFSFFIPNAQSPEASKNITLGKDTSSGFILLLEKSIPKDDISVICKNEWLKTDSVSRNLDQDKLEQINTAIEIERNLPTKERNPINTYSRIRKIILERRIYGE